MIARTVESAWRHPIVAASGGDGMSAALFRSIEADERLLDSPALDDVVTVTLDLDRAVETLTLNGTGPAEPAEDRRLFLVPPGMASTIRVRGPWRLLQIYLPAAVVDEVAADIGLPRETCGIVFTPGFFVDPEVEVIGRALERRLAEGLTPTGLEADELALDVALLLITRHARLDFGNGFSIALHDLPVAGGRSRLDQWERILLAEIFEQLRESPEDAPKLLQGLFARASAQTGAGLSQISN
jgi:hypothetical protein